MAEINQTIIMTYNSCPSNAIFIYRHQGEFLPLSNGANSTSITATHNPAQASAPPSSLAGLPALANYLPWQAPLSPGQAGFCPSLAVQATNIVENGNARNKGMEDQLSTASPHRSRPAQDSHKYKRLGWLTSWCFSLLAPVIAIFH